MLLSELPDASSVFDVIVSSTFGKSLNNGRLNTLPSSQLDDFRHNLRHWDNPLQRAYLDVDTRDEAQRANQKKARKFDPRASEECTVTDDWVHVASAQTWAVVTRWLFRVPCVKKRRVSCGVV